MSSIEPHTRVDTPAGSGLLLDSGLWLDRPDAGAAIAARQRDGRLTADQARHLGHFAEHGYVTLPSGADDAVLDGVETAVERAWRQRPADLAYASGGPARRMSDSDEARDRRPGYRIHDLHSASDAALELYLLRRIFELARPILGDDAVAIQSLYFQWGSQQILHRDPVVVPTGAPGHLLAAWIALEDIHPDSGALVYVPGSHRLPYYEFAPGVWQFDGATMGEAEARAATAFDDRLAELNGLEPQLFTPRRGELLLWHASLRHGGSPLADPRRTRRSFVVHLSTLSTYGERSITLSEPAGEPGGAETPRVYATRRLLGRGDRRGFDNPLNTGG